MIDTSMEAEFPYDKPGREIAYDEARTWVDTYRKNTEKQRKPLFAEAFSREVLMKMLADDNCSGIRIYHGIQDGESRLLLVGMDKHGNDRSRKPLGIKDEMPGDNGGSGIYGDGAKCPSECGN